MTDQAHRVAVPRIPSTSGGSDVAALRSTPPPPSSSSPMPTRPSSSASDMAAAARPPARQEHVKVDSILYNFYMKMVAIVSGTRLTHWHDLETFLALEGGGLGLDLFDDGAGQREGSSSSGAPVSQATPQSSTVPANSLRRINKWFSLPLPDLDIFKEEIRLWRNISSFIPAAALEASVETPASEGLASTNSYVPTMVLDVILDPARLQKGQSLTVQVPSGSASSSQHQIKLTGGSGSGSQSSQQSHKPIVLERWRIDFSVFQPDSPPDPPTFYKRCITQTRSLYTLAKSLPSQRLYRRLRYARLAQGSREAISLSGSEEAAALDSLLSIGCRMGAGPPDDEESGQEIGLRERIADNGSGNAETDSVAETNIRGLAPIISSLGSVTVSVEYRTNVEFIVTDELGGSSLKSTPQRSKSGSVLFTGIASIDEDYFRPKPAQVRASPVKPSRSSTGDNETQVAGPSSSGAVAEFPATPSVNIEQPPPSSPSSNASPTPSLFGSSLPPRPRPVAGLSSLRHQSSLAAMAAPIASSAATTPFSEAQPPSALAMALGSSPSAAEPAFLTSHNRRTSMSDRRLRTIGQLSSDRSSPPSPLAANASAPLRPALPAQMRFGSYSPSSPSPLAQQLASSSPRPAAGQVSARQAGGFRGPSSVPGHSPTASSASGSRTSLPPHMGISLRSIFDDYTAPKTSGQGSAMSVYPRRPSSTVAATPPVRLPLQKRDSGGSVTSAGRRSSDERSSTMLSGGTSTISIHRPNPQPSSSPQMIQRYSRTPSYRQERRIISGSIGESEAEGSATGEGGGSGEVTSGSYSRSWQARTEARQAMIANAMQRGSLGSHASAGPSPSSFLARPSPLPAQASRTPSTTSAIGRKGSINDLVAMIESRPRLDRGTEGLPEQQERRRPGLTPNQPSSHPASFSPEGLPIASRRPMSGVFDPRQPAPSLARRLSQRSGASGPSSSPGPPSPLAHSPQTTGQRPASRASPTSSASSSALTLSRSAVDELLAKMSLNVTRLKTLPTAAPSSAPVTRGGSGSHSSDGRDYVEGGLGATTSSDRWAEDASVRRTAMTRNPATSPALARPSAARPFPATSASMSRRYPATTSQSRSRGDGGAESSDPASQDTSSRSGGGDGASINDTISRQGHSYDAVDYDDEDDHPVGRLELHSEPSTPHGALSPSPLARPGSSNGNAEHRTTGERELDRPGDMDLEGGLGAMGPSDAERLRLFGEDLSSTRGNRRGQSPWHTASRRSRANTGEEGRPIVGSPAGAEGSNLAVPTSSTMARPPPATAMPGAFAIRTVYPNAPSSHQQSGRTTIYSRSASPAAALLSTPSSTAVGAAFSPATIAAERERERLEREKGARGPSVGVLEVSQEDEDGREGGWREYQRPRQKELEKDW